MKLSIFPRGHGRPARPSRHLWVLLVLTLVLAIGVGQISVAQSVSCTQLLADSGLETGSGWNTQTNGSYALFSSNLVYDGQRAAHLAGVNNANDQLSTTLKLPTGKSSLNLSLWWQVGSEDQNSDFDGLSVLITDAAGKTLKSLLTLGGDNVTGNWQQSTLSLNDFAGQTVQLKFWAQTDETLVTDFYLDDVAVTACDTSSQGFNLFLPITKR